MNGKREPTKICQLQTAAPACWYRVHSIKLNIESYLYLHLYDIRDKKKKKKNSSDVGQTHRV